MPSPKNKQSLRQNAAEIDSTKKQIAEIIDQLQQLHGTGKYHKAIGYSNDPYKGIADPEYRWRNATPEKQAEQAKYVSTKIKELDAQLTSLKDLLAKLQSEDFRRVTENAEDKKVSDRTLDFTLRNPSQTIYADEGEEFGTKHLKGLNEKLTRYTGETSNKFSWSDYATTYLPAEAVMSIKEVKRDVDYLIQQDLLDPGYAFELDDIRKSQDLIMVGSRIEKILSNPRLQKEAAKRPSKRTPTEEVYDLDESPLESATKIVITTK